MIQNRKILKGSLSREQDDANFRINLQNYSILVTLHC